MFKLALALLAVSALAADTEAPVISLSLVTPIGSLPATGPFSLANHTGEQKFIFHRQNETLTHDTGDQPTADITQPDSATAESHFADECKMSGSGDCTLPSASAYDHHDGVIDSATIAICQNVFVSSPPCTSTTWTSHGCRPQEDNTAESCATGTTAAITRNTRAEYVLDYNVDDASGNSAAEIRFAMIVLDDVAPVKCAGNTDCGLDCAAFQTNGGTHVAQGEFSNHADDKSQFDSHRNCLQAKDNIDGYNLQFWQGTPGVGGADILRSWNNYGRIPAAYSFPNATCIANGSVTTVAADYAMIFGDNYESNQVDITITWTTTDTKAPYLLNTAATRNQGSDPEGDPYALTQNNFDYTNAFGTGNTATDATTLECKDTAGLTYYNYPNTDAANLFTWSSNTGFVDDGDACNGVSPTVNHTHNWDPSTTFSSKTAAQKKFNVSYYAHDSNGIASGEYWYEFDVVDNTPPVVRIEHEEYNATHTWQAANGGYMMQGSRHKSEQGTGTYAANDGTTGANLYSHNNATAVSDMGTMGSSVQNLGYATDQVSLIQHSAGYLKDGDQIEQWASGFYCYDDCHNTNFAGTHVWHKIDSALGCDDINSTSAAHTGPNATSVYSAENTFDIIEVGTYVIKYTCDDTSNNLKSMCRTVINVDHSKPVIHLVEDPPSGSADACAHWASVSDANALLAASGTCVESNPSANYVDAGAQCSDQVDGLISELVEVSGQVVDLNNPDTYEIHYNCKDTAGNDAQQLTRSVYVIDATCPTCFINGCDHHTGGSCIQTVEASFPYFDEGAECEDRNGNEFSFNASLTAWDPTNPAAQGQQEHHAYDAGSGLQIICDEYPWSGGAGPTSQEDANKCVDVELTGTYRITYKYTDAANNTNLRDTADADSTCNEFANSTRGSEDGNHQPGEGFTYAQRPPQVRTVVVEDKLEPIIYLTDQIGTMEQQSTVNGWVVAAVGSAVAGVALLSFSFRRDVATPVPV